MNPIAEEMRAIIEDDNELTHYGMPRRSGRYPWGSGDDPYQRHIDLLGRYQEYKKQGMSEPDIAKAMGMLNEKGQPSTGKLRLELRYAKDERRLYDIARAKSLAADGKGPTAIGKEMGVRESTVRSWLDPKSEANTMKGRKTAEFIKEQINKKGMIDVGAGVERELNVSPGTMKEALFILEKEGYPTYSGRIPQATNPGKHTTQTVVCPPGYKHKDIYRYDEVHSLNDYVSHDGGETFHKFVYPKSMDSKRLMIRYADDIGPDGARGIDKDGIVEIRRNVADLSLGESHYSQVRILVDDKKYIKGMAVYSDNMPDGVDVVFNTNKTKDVAKMDVLKTIKDDPDNPFGSLIKAGGQSYYTDKDGKQQLSLINKRADEGDWTEWKDALPSQFLGKQSRSMAKQQLNLAKADKLAEFDEIRSLTNPTIKKHLLEEFANNCDSAAVHLKAAALPGQKYHVIIPINSLKDNEVYAPGYEPGSKLALVRYPHGGTFEIPILTVNNKNATAKKIIGTSSIDAIGINKNIADRLSGADFDGDTVMCIPTHDKRGKVKVTSTPPLKGLEGFDPKTAYGYDRMEKDSSGKEHYYRNGQEIKIMKNTNIEMGKISNLITDMTLAGAGQDKLARAVRHSMVVIDAEKHKLDYKSSEVENNIAALKKEFQTKVLPDGTVKVGGASTILSKAKGEHRVLKRQGTPKINQKGKEWYDPDKPEGALIYRTADDLTYEVTTTNKRTGKTTTTTKYRTQISTNMAETDDAHTLVSGGKHPMELLYADYANSMKALANQARKEIISTGRLEYSDSAKKTYQKEVKDLNDKLNNALLNNPRERAAQRMTYVEVANKKAADPTLKPKDIKKLNSQGISAARNAVGATSRRNRNIDITDREWAAIQAGAISESTLKKILQNTDTDELRKRATPRASNSLSTAQVNRIRSMSNSNYSLSEIARKLGVSTSVVSKYLKGAN